jgi:hypothetical protein
MADYTPKRGKMQPSGRRAEKYIILDKSGKVCYTAVSHISRFMQEGDNP